MTYPSRQPIHNQIYTREASSVKSRYRTCTLDNRDADKIVMVIHKVQSTKNLNEMKYVVIVHAGFGQNMVIVHAGFGQNAQLTRYPAINCSNSDETLRLSEGKAYDNGTTQYMGQAEN